MKSRRWVPTVLALLMVILALWSHSGWRPARVAAQAQPRPDPTAAAPTGKPNKRALLVGINNYKYSDKISPLAGSLNDVEDMRQVLIGKFEFPPENILVLKDSQATHAAIMSAIQTHLIDKTQPGDIVVFDYSGHGSQMKDVTGKKSSGLDETIVPYDSRDPEGKVFDISGAELHASLVKLSSRTKNLTFILDSCHSGTLVRGARVRFTPADTREVSPAVVSATRGLSTSTSTEDVSPRFVSLSAATSRENAFEHYADGQDHGSLTYFLTRQLRTAPAGATYRDVMDSVIGNVTANYPAQHPSLEGAEADQHIFGDATSLAGNYVVASPSLLDAKRVTLGTGQVQGATVGSTYDVYPPGSRKFAPPERPEGRVQLVSVTAFTSEATVLSGGKIAPASRAVQREHRYGAARLRVSLEDVDKSPALQALQGALAPVKVIEVVDNCMNCNVMLRQVGQSIQTLSGDSRTELSPRVNANDANATERLVSQLQQWVKWFNVLSIRNGQAQIDVSLDLKGPRTRDPMARIGKPDAGVLVGDPVTFNLVNHSERDLYIGMLDLSADGSISVLYPAEQGAAEVLKPGAVLTQTFNATLPKDRSTVIDVVKVFASYKPIDLLPLTQGRVRSAEGPDSLAADTELDPIQQLLMDSSGVTRGLTPVLSKPLDLGTWTTLQRVLFVRRKS